MKKGSLTDCIAKNWKTADGTKVSGHVFLDKLGVYDEGTDRSYMIGECENCGTMDAGWSEGESALLERSQQVIRLGGHERS